MVVTLEKEAIEEGNLVEVDGERPIDVIHKDIVNRIEKKLQNRQ